MLFVSYQFIFLLVSVVILYYTLFRKKQWQFLLFASYVFYLMSGIKFTIYLVASILIVYFTALAIDKLHEDDKNIKEKNNAEDYKKIHFRILKKQKIWFNLGLFGSLSVLLVVKYTNFMILNLNIIWNQMAGNEPFSFINILLPMGISFYTFQSIGYLIDVYRGKYRAEKSLGKYALFVSFFPQLVQGPISRYNDLSKSLYQKHDFDLNTFTRALYRLLWGYFKKMVIADRILVAVKLIIDKPDYFNGSFAFLGMIFYAIQLYADFTGGIDITIAIAEMLGIKVAENFKRPYFSKSVKEYWRRWHITMGTWFTEYVFYPLSVSRAMIWIANKSRKKFGRKIGRKVPVYLSTIIVWFLTGFWHGAGWNFIVWGLLNAFVMLLSEELKGVYDKFHSIVPNFKKTRIYDLLCIIRTFLIMSSFRMLDCYGDVGVTWKAFLSIFTVNNWHEIFARDLSLDYKDYIIVFLGVILMILISLISRNKDIRNCLLKKPIYIQYMVIYLLFIIILVFGAYGIGFDSSQFIYNRF